MLKIATWNVNSLTVRLSQVVEWLKENQPDVLALQEIKMQNDAFPFTIFEELGYHALVSGQKTYNGVAMLSCIRGNQPLTELIDFADDPQRRVLGMLWQDIYIVNVYVPNGNLVGCDKYQYKLIWLNHLYQTAQILLNQYDKLIILGDFNIAPTDEDVFDPIQWKDGILVSPLERDALQRLLTLGLQDIFRLFAQTPQSFSWWDYRANAFRRNLGARIDLILASASLITQCASCTIDKTPRRLPRPSDHTPVIATFI